MAQSAGIANAVIPVESGPKPVLTEGVSRRNKKHFPDSSDSLNKAEEAPENSPKTSSPDEESSSSPFSMVLQEKLEKKDKVPPEETTQTEETPELSMQDVSMSSEYILTKDALPKDIPAETISKQIVSNKVSVPVNNVPQIVNQTEKPTENGRFPAVPSAISEKGTVETEKTQGQILTPLKESVKQGIAADGTKPVEGSKNQVESTQKAPLTAGTDTSASRPESPKEAQSPVQTNRNQTQIPEEKQTQQISSSYVEARPPRTQDQAAGVQTQPLSRPEINTLQPHQELTAKPSAAVKQESTLPYTKISETVTKESKSSDTSKSQVLSENTVLKSAYQNPAETLSEVSRPISSAEIHSTPSRVLTQTATVSPAASSASQTAYEPSAPLSAAQQVLRGIQTTADSEVRTIQVALSPAGLGMVRIQLQREGEEISGVLEVQKTETRREIEKSLPQIIAVLDSQGLQVRRIDVNPLPNPAQKQQDYDAADGWALHREMSEQEQSDRRTGSSSEEEFFSGPSEEIINPDIEKSYKSFGGSENLNLFA